MAITVEATYEGGILKPVEPLPLADQAKVRVTVHSGPAARDSAYGVVGWTGSVEDLNRLIEDDDNDPLEGR